MRPVIRIKAAAKAKAGLSFRLKAVQLLSLSEPEAARLIFKLEQDPLFERLRAFIRREKPKGGGFSLQLKDDRHGLQAAPEIAWSAYRREIGLIKKIGHARFEKYFLYGDVGYSADQVSEFTGLSLAEVRQIRGFVFAVSMQEHGARNIQHAEPGGRSYSCIARVEVGKGRPALVWLLPQLARGRYVVNFTALETFRKSGLTAEEAVRLAELLKTINLLNARQSAVKRLVELIVDSQRRFLVSGDAAKLRPLTASAAARRLQVYPSTVSRVAAGRSLLTPQGAELPLDFFLPNQRLLAARAIAGILKARPGETDRELAAELFKKHRIKLSRRAVNECRRLSRSS
jgi:hypothetical protein